MNLSAPPTPRYDINAFPEPRIIKDNSVNRDNNPKNIDTITIGMLIPSR